MIWNKAVLTYRAEGSLPGIGRLVDDHIRSAASAWSAAGVVRLQTGKTADLLFRCRQDRFLRLGLADSPRPDGQPIQCLLNSRRFWCLSSDKPGVLLPAVLSHEIGHLLGLPHSPAAAHSVMTSRWNRRSPRLPTAEDLEALRRLYRNDCKNDHDQLWLPSRELTCPNQEQQNQD